MHSDIAGLLAEAPWLARLAQSLARDPAEAADAVQETWIAALRSPPDPARPARPWLRRVLVNTLRMRQRSRRRRDTHESATELLAAPAPATDQLIERAQVERRLAELVLALAEPYRTTVLLRYREGVTAEAIAKQQGIPAATVRTRLKTALDRLRRELDDDEPAHGWRALFVPVACAPVPKLIGGVVMAKTLKVVAVLVVLVLLLAGGWWWWRGGGDGDDERGATVASREAVGKGGGVARERHAAAGWDPSALFAQPGIASRAIAGRVTYDGEPLAGATVHLADATTRMPLAEVASGPGGEFAFGPRVAATYVVVATAPAKTAATVAVDLRDPTVVTTTLELALVGCTSKLAGTVRDAAGGVIGGARIAPEHAPWPAAETDANGSYELCLPFGHASLEVSAAGYSGRMLAVDIDRVTRRDIALIPEATIAGTVVDGAGRPVAGAWVTVEPAGAEIEGRSATAAGWSDVDGTFRIERVAAGRNRIIATAPSALSTSALGVVAIGGRVLEGVVVRVDAVARMTGIVVAAGEPVAGLVVAIRVGNHDAYRVSARTQANGRFELDRVPPGDLAPTVANHAVLAPRSIRVTGTTPVDVRIEIAALGAITGRVLRGGRVVADAQVDCPQNRSTHSDQQGRYICSGLAPGRYQLMAAVGDGRWGTLAEPLAIAGGETKHGDIELAYSAEICGRVVDERGDAFAQVDVGVHDGGDDSGHAVTEADGRFCIRFLAGGRYRVAAVAGGRPLEPSAAVTVGANARVTVELGVRRPDLAIAGSVSDSTGAAVPDAIVRITAGHTGDTIFRPWTAAALATTDAAGAFRIPRLSAGEYTLVASGRDGSEAIVAGVRAGTEGASITLDAAGAVAGRLVGFANTPTLIGSSISGTRQAVPIQIAGDRFEAGGLSPGNYVFTAHTGLGESVSRAVRIEPGKTATFDLASPGSATLVVSLFDLTTKAPAAGMTCTALGRAGHLVGNIYTAPATPVRSDAAGKLVLDPAPAGEILVLCHGSSGPGARMITLARDERLELAVPVVTAPGREVDLGFDIDFSHRVNVLAPGGAGERAGLALYDTVTAVDGIDVAQLAPGGVSRLLRRHRPGEVARLATTRGGAARTLELVVQ